LNNSIGAISLASNQWEALPHTVRGNDVVGVSRVHHKLTPLYGYFNSQYKTHLFNLEMGK
jgi:hypothetical protein